MKKNLLSSGFCRSGAPQIETKRKGEIFFLMFGFSLKIKEKRQTKNCGR